MIVYRVVNLHLIFRERSLKDKIRVFQDQCAALGDKGYRFAEFSPFTGDVIFEKDRENGDARRDVKILYCNDMDMLEGGLEAALNEAAKQNLALRRVLSYPYHGTSHYLVFALLESA